MSHQLGVTGVIDDSTLKSRASGEIYVTGDGLTLTSPILAGTVSGSASFASGSLRVVDSTNGKTYQLIVTNGVVTPTEV